MTGIFSPDAALINLLPLALDATKSSLRYEDGEVVAAPSMTNAVAKEILASAQPILMVAYDGLRRDRPGGPHHLYVCDAGCWTVVAATRAKSTCATCGQKTRTKVDLPWINIAKAPSRAQHKRHLASIGLEPE
jgi:hypothetical protein